MTASSWVPLDLTVCALAHGGGEVVSRGRGYAGRGTFEVTQVNRDTKWSRFVVDRGHLEQRETKVGDAPEKSLKLGLITRKPDQRRTAVGRFEGHAVESGGEAAIQFPVDDQAIGASDHFSSIAPVLR